MTMRSRVSSPLLYSNLLVLLLCLSPDAHLLADTVPNWDRAVALQAAAVEEGQQQVDAWLQQIDAGQAIEVLDALQHSAATGTPAFEAQLHALALSMAEAAPNAANEQLLGWLENYSPEVLVAHEESSSYGVPLFPVNAAAKGARHEWQRRMAEQQAGQLLADPLRWIEAYLAASPAGKQGLEQALGAANPDDLAALAEALQSRVVAKPELAMPAGIAAGNLADHSLFLTALQHSQGAATVQILRQANWRLDASQRSQLFNGLLALPESASAADEDSDKAALGISLLAPGLYSNPAVSNRLLELLDDQQLGAAAALALAGHPDSRVQASLLKKLQGGGLAAQRAALALDQPPPDSLEQQPDGDPE